MGFDLKKLVRGAAAQLNPFDGNQTFDTVMRGAKPTPPPPASTARPSVAYPNFTQPNPLPPASTRTPLVPHYGIGANPFAQFAGGVATDLKNFATRVPAHLALQGMDMLQNTQPGTRNVFTPKPGLEQALLGSEPIKSYQGQAEDTQKMAQQWGSQHGVTISPALTVPIAGALALMDLTALKPGNVKLGKQALESAGKPIVGKALEANKAVGQHGYIRFPGATDEAQNAGINQLARTAKNPQEFKGGLQKLGVQHTDEEVASFMKQVKHEVGVEGQIAKANPNLKVKPEDSPSTKLVTLENIKQQAGKNFQDTGEKMFGSRKDLSKFKVIRHDSLEHLEAQGERVAQSMVTKARVLGQDAKYTPNTQGSPSLERLKHVVLSAIPGKPTNSPLARQAYVDELPAFVQAIKNAPDEAAVRKAMSEFSRPPTGGLGTSESPLTYNWEQARRVRDNYGTRFYNVLRENSMDIREAIYRPATDFSWAEKKAGEAVKKGSGPSLHGGELQPYERTGGQAVGKMSPEDIKKTFNLKGIEYGNWVKDKEAGEHVQRYADALHDFEATTNMNLGDLMREMNLGTAFGARGHGSALAHYEPTTKVINVTKKKGADGTVGHELGHALDDWLGDGKLRGYASGDKSPDPEIRQAFRRVQDALKGGKSVQTIERKGSAPEGYRVPVVDSYLEKFGGDAQKVMDELMARYPGTGGKQLERIAQYLLHKANAPSVNIQRNVSAFWGKAAEKGGYWDEPTEKFARAFADYLRVKGNTIGLKNNYLTHHDDIRLNSPLFTHDNPEAVMGAMDDLMATIKRVKGIGDAPKRNPLASERGSADFDAALTPKSKKSLAKLDATERETERLLTSDGVKIDPKTKLEELYHATPKYNRDSITKRGLQPQDKSRRVWGESEDGFTHYSTTPEKAIQWVKNAYKERGLKPDDIDVYKVLAKSEPDIFGKSNRRVKGGAEGAKLVQTVGKDFRTGHEPTYPLKSESGFANLNAPIVGKPLPKKTSTPKPKTEPAQRGFAKQLAAESDPVLDQVVAKIPGYKPITNKGTIGKVVKEIGKDPNAAYARFITKPLGNADDVMAGHVMLRQALEAGDVDKALTIGRKLGVEPTPLAQAVQAYAAWKKTTPEGIFNDAIKNAAKAGKELDPAVGKDLVARATKIAEMPEGLAKSKATRAMLDESEKLGRTYKDLAADIFNMPRAMMATADFSAPLRQGIVLGSRYPKQFAKSFTEMFKYWGKPAYYEQAMYDITQRPTYALMKSHKLAVDGATKLTGTEEQFLSSLLESNAAKKIGVGHVIAASDRAYSGFLTKLRADVFDHVMQDFKAKGTKLNAKQIDSLTKFINSASGRGQGHYTDKISNLQVLFSARLWKSRLDTLNPAYYARLDPVARKLALQSTASFAGITGSLLGLLKLSGLEVGVDPRSADFAKVKVGNTRYDILGGHQQNIRLLSQIITGTKINSVTGEEQTLGADRGFGKPSRLDLLYQFLENKENPIIAWGTKMLRGTDQIGEPINPVTETGKLAIPLTLQQTYETVQDVGDIGQGIAMNIPGTFGVGVQTYGKPKEKTKTDANGDEVPSTGSRTLDASAERVTNTKRDLPTGISRSAEKVLLDYAKLNDNGKNKYNDDPQRAYALHKAQYEYKKLKGQLTQPEDVKLSQSLRRESITSKYSQEVNQFYNLTKAQQSEAFRQDADHAKALYGQAKQLDAELVGAKLRTTKFAVKRAKKGRKGASFNYAAHMGATFSLGARNTSAVRNLVKRVRITRKKAKA